MDKYANVAFLWTYPSIPSPPWQLFLVDIEFPIACYAVCAKSPHAAQRFFMVAFPWCKVREVRPAPTDWEVVPFLADWIVEASLQD